MGWFHLYSCPTKKDLVEHLKRNFKFTDYSVRGNVLYGLASTIREVTDNFGDTIEVPDGGSVIVVCLLDCDRSKPNYPMWGYKGMDETCGPCVYDCPERILAKSTVPDESGWRAACRELAATAFKPREWQWYEFSTPLEGETRWQYCRQKRSYKRDSMYWQSENGQRFRISNVGKRFKPRPV